MNKFSHTLQIYPHDQHLCCRHLLVLDPASFWRSWESWGWAAGPAVRARRRGADVKAGCWLGKILLFAAEHSSSSRSSWVWFGSWLSHDVTLTGQGWTDESLGEEVHGNEQLGRGLVVEVDGQAGGRVVVLLPRVVDIFRLVVMYGNIPQDGAGGKLQEWLSMKLGFYSRLYRVQHVVVVGAEGLPHEPPRLAAGGLGSQASSGGRHHPSSLLGTVGLDWRAS